MFVSRLPTDTTEEELKKYIEIDTDLKTVVCTRLKIRKTGYASFHITSDENEFAQLCDPCNFPEDCLVTSFKGPLYDSQKYVNKSILQVENQISEVNINIDEV